MSVCEEQTECPLCMELLEMDDINFYPCTCGYQICRFCWHRIRTDENGLCPACRKQYPEDPAEFKPLTEEELQRIKKDRRQKDLQRKQKAAENRKHLANVRVVQKNLVFIVGLSQRLAEAEVLRKHEYFGKFGKLHKVVINQSTSYAGAQGPSASAYVTYNRAEDALRAIQAVNNIHFDGRTLKASLGTTKYCSHFLRGAQCPKPDCMYLHELGEEAASFTKEEMQQGKHQEYEQKLHEQFMNSQNLVANHHLPVGSKTQMGSSPPSDAVPSLLCANLVAGGAPTPHNSNLTMPPSSTTPPNASANNNCVLTSQPIGGVVMRGSSPPLSGSPSSHHSPPLPSSVVPPPSIAIRQKLPFIDNTNADSMSLFSASGFAGRSALVAAASRAASKTLRPPQLEENIPPPPPATDIPDTMPVASSTDWQAAFGFSSSNTDSHDDDLGFDPWDESTKALADLIEKEGGSNPAVNPACTTSAPTMPPYPVCSTHHCMAPPSNLPPGFSPNHFGTFAANPMLPPGMKMPPAGFAPPLLTAASRMTAPPPSMPPSALQANGHHAPASYHDMLADIRLAAKADWLAANPHAPEAAFSVKDWQDGLRALLPNINISFGGAPPTQPPPPSIGVGPMPPQGLGSNPMRAPTQPSTKDMCLNSAAAAASLTRDPAIITSGDITDLSCEEPHWMASLQQLTDETTPSSRRLPFVQQFHHLHHHHHGAAGGGPGPWPTVASAPPPGFHHPTSASASSQLRRATESAPQPLAATADGLQ